MKKDLWNRVFRRRIGSVLLLFFVYGMGALQAQQAGTLTGIVQDPRGSSLLQATVSAKNEATGAVSRSAVDAQGRFSISGLAAAKYTVEASAPGFSSTLRRGLQMTPGQTNDVTLTLTLGNVSQQVTVEAGETNSIAAQLAPMDAPLSSTSARTIIGQPYIQNFTSPLADYGEITQMVPGTFTTNANGVGLGQSNTNFRGFSDGNYDIDFDGVPFYDTNTPTHHSWAFFPSPWIGGVDFDRSPGRASTIGPTPFGGSIHLLSQPLSPLQNVRGGVSYGSFNTFLFDGQYDSGSFGGAMKRSNFFLDVHHASSDGYQTLNLQTRNAGSLKYQYKFSDRTVFTGFSGVIWLDANTPNLSSSRATLLANGDNYLLQSTDPTQATYYRYNTYHVPTDFEYVGINSELGHGWAFDFKPYTYNYDNSQFYAKQPKSGPINTASCLPVKGISPCAVDKYNSYRKYGETLAVSQVSKLGIFRTGLWYEWANTNRHQFPTNLFTRVDDTLPNFSETYKTNSLQPYAEFEFHVSRKLSVTPGIKFAYYTMSFKQFADNGGKIGNLNGQPFVLNNVDYHSWLPSFDVNYRIKPNWSVYAQVATGSVVPPTSVFDVSGGVVAVPPKPQRSTTYQTGTILKLKRLTFDADYYRIRFQNGYSSSTVTDPNSPLFGESINFIAPSSITQGGEFQGNLYLGAGLSLFLNGSRGQATYVGTLTVYPNGQTGTANGLVVQAPSGLWTAESPTDTEAEGLTYQRRGFDLGFFNKRVGSQWEDNGAYHNQQRIDPFSVANVYLNYTIRSGSRFDQTKVRLSVNNLADSHNQTSVKPGGALITSSFTANGLKYTDPFSATTTTSPGFAQGQNLADSPSLLPGRSIMLSVTFGLSPKR